MNFCQPKFGGSTVSGSMPVIFTNTSRASRNLQTEKKANCKIAAVEGVEYCVHKFVNTPLGADQLLNTTSHPQLVKNLACWSETPEVEKTACGLSLETECRRNSACRYAG